MKHAILVGLLVASALLVALPQGNAIGDVPVHLRSYQFIPHFSTLHQTGGFAGVDVRYSITGGFNLVTGFDHVFDPPRLVPFARFTDVDAVAHHPFHDFPQSLDDLLNLSGLHGTFEPSAPNHLLFEGVDGQGAPMHVEVDLFGRLMLLQGANAPPPHSADFFNYEINAVVLQTPFADFNSDGKVDGNDFLIWQENFGKVHPAVLGVPGDANADGIVDGDDFLIWQREYRTDLSGASSTAIPEPATVVITLLTAVTALALRRND